MKRTSLVDYEDDSDDSNEHPRDQEPSIQKEEKPSKRRRLAAPSASLVPTVPVDDPSKHQGRTRSTPHSEGQFAAYVYLSVNIDPGSPFYFLVTQALNKCVESSVRKVYRIPSNELVSSPVAEPTPSIELHISLTRPIFLRAHQRLELKKSVESAATLCSRFSASFAQFKELSNDEGTRHFLTLEVGAGHKQMCTLTNALAPTLRSFRQKEFYIDPKFHASFAWTPAISSDVTSGSNEQATSFPVESLSADFGTLLTTHQYEVEYVTVKIGKEISRFQLAGRS